MVNTASLLSQSNYSRLHMIIEYQERMNTACGEAIRMFAGNMCTENDSIGTVLSALLNTTEVDSEETKH